MPTLEHHLTNSFTPCFIPAPEPPRSRFSLIAAELERTLRADTLRLLKALDKTLDIAGSDPCGWAGLRLSRPRSRHVSFVAGRPYSPSLPSVCGGIQEDPGTPPLVGSCLASKGERNQTLCQYGGAGCCFLAPLWVMVSRENH